MVNRIEVYSHGSEKADVYTIDKELSNKQLTEIASILSNSVYQTASINYGTSFKQFLFAVEIGFLPGVTDNVANTVKEIIEDRLKISFSATDGIYSSQLIFFRKKFPKNLINPLIQRIHVKNYSQYKKDKGMDKIAPKVKLTAKPKVDSINLNISDEELIKIGKLGIENSDGSRRGPLALDLAYMKTIRDYFKKLKRNPTDIELESIAQTWSEHCKHTIFADPIDDIKNGLFKTYIKAATDNIKKKSANGRCVSVFTDNSGAIEFDDKYLVTHKVETHNSPSALDPFGGAITGIVGVNRDAIGFGLGAKPIINTYGFCFASPKEDRVLYKDSKLTQRMLSPQKIMEGVIAGVNSGGNCSGIPTPQGFLVFDQRYQGKPLVFVGTLGLIPKTENNKKTYIKKAKKGDYIVVVGGRVGQDGIHGATFSSEALNSASPAGAVQIGDPITQKKLSDALVKEARSLSLYNSITDNGAGGLSCSVAEMAKESGGCLVNLDKVPLKYPGLAPWQIWISESQERMTLSVPKNKWTRFKKLMQKRGVEATVIGEFTKDKKCTVTYKGEKIMDIDMQFLHYGLPSRPMKTKAKTVILNTPRPSKIKNLTSEFEKILKNINNASFEFISMQYDHEVQGGSVLKPLVGRGRINSEATVVRPVLDSKKAVVISQGILPHYSDIDTYYMAASCIDTSIRNIVAVGADINKIALLDNFCWCSSNEPERLWELKNAVKACYDYSLIYESPFISGKDSMFNDFKGFDESSNPIKISIPPTLLISSIAVVDDYSFVVSLDAKFPGDLIYLLGETSDSLEIDGIKNKKLYTDYFKCIKKRIIASSIGVGRGGLAVAIAKTAMAGMFGVDMKADIELFSESQGRILVTIAPKNKKDFENIMSGNAFSYLGKVTTKPSIIIRNKNKVLVNLSLTKALKAYKSTFKGL